MIAGVFIVLKAAAYWLDRYELLSGDRKQPTFTGAGYTDIHAAMPAKLVLLAIAVLCAAAFFAVIVLRDMRIPALAAALLQHRGDTPRIPSRWRLSATPRLSGNRHQEPSRGARRSDHDRQRSRARPRRPGEDVHPQQQLKNFYSFADQLDLDRYRIDGQLRDYVVGVRELSPTV